MHRVVPALRGADGPRRARVARLRDERVVRTLAVGHADGVDRREVEHVEAHVGHAGEAIDGGAERAADHGPVVAARGALRAREELVPGAHAGALALDEQLGVFTDRDESHHRPDLEQRGDRGVAHDLQGGVVVHLRVAQRAGGVVQAVLVAAGALLLASGAVEQLGAHLAHERGVDTCGDLQVGRVLPCREVVGERLEPEAPHALLERGHEGRPAVEAVVEGAESMQRLVTRGREQSHLDADAVVPLAECGDREGNGFAQVRGRAEPPTRDARMRQGHRDARRDHAARGRRRLDRTHGNRGGAAPGQLGRRSRRGGHDPNLPRATDVAASFRAALTGRCGYSTRNSIIDAPVTGTTSPAANRAGADVGVSSALDHRAR